MPTTFSPCLPRAVPRPPLSSMPRRRFLPPAFGIVQLRTSRTTVVCASAASFDELDAKGWARARSAKSVLSDLIHEIEPLDTSLIQKDVPAVTVDAMKRTISGMLGILPSDRFNVMVEALWERLFKLLVSSMMTGYTLRNAEFRLSIEKILEKMENHHNKEEHLEKDENKNISCNNPDKLQSSSRTSSRFQLTGRDALLFNSFKGEEVLASEDINYECLGELSPEAKECICNLKTRLSALEKDLHEVRRKNSALQMQQFVGEEKNDLLDYLRSLQPEKVIELSEPTSPEVHEIVRSIAHGLLATLSPKMHSKPPPESDGVPGGTMSVGEDDRTEMLENASLHLQPLIAVPRDYLARLLFWCLLLGHHLRGLEHRLELMQLLTVDGRT